MAPPGSEEAPPVRCAWCRRLLGEHRGPGRPRTYCRRSCRQRAFEARQAAQEVDWAADRLRGQAAVIDEVALLWRVLTDVLEPRGLGPVDELDTAAVAELVERLRAIVGELGGVVRQVPAGDRS